jgi:indolepyruvate ferredoxin oxidoreductase beta subunit
MESQIHTQIIVCGRGGQGILFLTKLLDEAAISERCDVISSETHGMAMRGGSVVSYIKIGGYHSPLVSTGQADVLLVLSKTELERNRYLLKKDCEQVYVNDAAAGDRVVDATRLAEDLGSVVVTNLVLLGFACGHAGFPFSYAKIKSVLEKISPEKAVNLNLKALERGYEQAVQ